MKSGFKISFLLSAALSFFSLSSQAAVGGISGGGGGTVIASPVGAREIGSILNDARSVAFRFYATQLRSILPQIATNLDGQQVLNAILNYGINISSQDSCFDSEKNPKDASIFSSMPNTICVSSKTLGEKLNQTDAWTQTMALVIHEYSHLAGADEAIADVIQNYALAELNRNMSYRSRDDNFQSGYSEFIGTIPRAYWLHDSLDNEQIAKFSFDMQTSYNVSGFDQADRVFSSMTKVDYEVSFLTPDQLTEIQKLLPLWNKAYAYANCYPSNWRNMDCETNFKSHPEYQDPKTIDLHLITLLFEDLRTKLIAVRNKLDLNISTTLYSRGVFIDGVPAVKGQN